MVFLDALQWADDSTIDMLGRLVRQAETEGILFVAATWPVVPGSRLARLLRFLTFENRLFRLELSRLQPDDVNQVACSVSPDYAEAFTEWLEQRSEGNPYALTELIRDARDRRLLLPNGLVDLHALWAVPTASQRVNDILQTGSSSFRKRPAGCWRWRQPRDGNLSWR